MNKSLAHPSLSGDALIETIKEGVDQIPDHRKHPDLPLADFTMGALAIFSIKLPSLLSVEKLEGKELANVKNIYRIKTLPSDTRMREVIDEINPEELAVLFSKLFKQVQRAKKLEDGGRNLPTPNARCCFGPPRSQAGDPSGS
jgi:hypothetical protein